MTRKYYYFVLTAIQTCIRIILLQDGPLGVDTDGALHLLLLLQTCCFHCAIGIDMGVGSDMCYP